VLLRAGLGDDVERRVRDVLADLAPDGDLGAAPDLDVLDGAPVLVREELRERVPGLVEVVVGVEDVVVECSCRHVRALGLAIGF